MKTSEALRLLQVSRPTLMRYRQRGIVRATPLPNGFFDYDEQSIYSLLNKGVKRRTYLYARVSTPKQKRDLDNQVELLKQWAFHNGHQINGIFTDIASGISFERRRDFFTMLSDVLKNRVETVIITYKDRLPRRQPETRRGRGVRGDRQHAPLSLDETLLEAQEAHHPTTRARRR